MAAPEKRRRARVALAVLHGVGLGLLAGGAVLIRSALVPALYALPFLAVIAGLLRGTRRILTLVSCALILLGALYFLALLLLAAQTVLPARAMAALPAVLVLLVLLEAATILFVLFSLSRKASAS